MLHNGFLTLLCRIEPLAGDRFRATTRGGRRGLQAVEFTLPLGAEARGEWLEHFREPFQPGQADRWRILEDFGTTLFNAIFRDENLATWRILREEARQNNLLLRLVLDLPHEALRPLPWEALYDPTEQFFLARDPHTCIIRYFRDPQQPAPIEPRLPLRILALISAPTGVPPLDVEGEKRVLEEALQSLIAQQEIELTWMDGRLSPATLARLGDEVARAADAGEPYDIFHYIGHAGWSPAQGEGVLLLENEEGRQAPTTAPALGDLLRRGGLRLAILNACEGSRVEEAAPFRSVAATLIRRADLPAVIANQIEISDLAARAFAAAFFRALAERRTIEEAMVRARHEMALSHVGNPEWVATVFFSRFEREAIRLLPPKLPKVDRGLPLLTTLALFLLATLLGIVGVSIFRTHGVVVGIAVQFVIGALAVWFAHDRWEHILRFRQYVLSALVLATLVVSGWFLFYQPVLHTAQPPPDFALSIEHPSPLAFRDEQIVHVFFSIDVHGQAHELPEGHHIWILIQAENSGTYVAGAEAVVQPDGRFIAREVVVGPMVLRPVGDRRYILQPVLVDEAGHRFLERQATPFWRFFHPELRVLPQPRLQNALVIRR